jgi:hypothetical protein
MDNGLYISGSKRLLWDHVNLVCDIEMVRRGRPYTSNCRQYYTATNIIDEVDC